jgi:hypothetical protein
MTAVKAKRAAVNGSTQPCTTDIAEAIARYWTNTSSVATSRLGAGHATRCKPFL